MNFLKKIPTFFQIKLITIFIIFLCFLVLLTLFVVNRTDSSKKVVDKVPAPSNYPTTLPEEVINKDLMLYKNEYYNFSLAYPSSLKVNEYAEDNGVRSIIFEDKDMSVKKGFQISIIPYSGNYVTKERFKIDEPSGVMKEPLAVIIGGIQGTIFYGYNDIMGDTREVWFINDGFLYEVVTYKDLDLWIADILKSWNFLVK